jgi:uncharacterized protein YerC
MAQVSRRVVDTTVLEKMNRLLHDCFIRCRDHETTTQFVTDLLTDTERIMIAKRLAIALMLLKDRTIAEIGERLKVSKQTIWMVQGLLRTRGEGFRSILEAVLRHEKDQEKENIGAAMDLDSPFPPPVGSNWRAIKRGQWKRLRETTEPF